MPDEKAPIALYKQLKQSIIENIKGGLWPADSKIPAERQLCEIYGVSRMTVRLALAELEKEGHLYRKQGKGTFISTPKIQQRLQNFYSFSDEIKKTGMSPDTQILQFDLIASRPDIAAALKIKEGDNVFRIKRLRLADHEPFAVETSYIPYELFPGLNAEDIKASGLYNTLRNLSGISVSEAEESFEAVIIDSESAGYLKVGKRFPGLLLERTAFGNGRIVEFCRSLIRTDRYKYNIILK